MKRISNFFCYNMENKLSTDIIFQTFKSKGFNKLDTYHFINDTINKYITYKLSKTYQKQLKQTLCLYCANNSNTNKNVFLYDITTIIQRYNRKIFKEYESKKNKKAI